MPKGGKGRQRDGLQREAKGGKGNGEARVGVAKGGKGGCNGRQWEAMGGSGRVREAKGGKGMQGEA